MSYFLGVDLGTTYTAAAVARGGRAEVVTLGTRSLEVPSIAYLRDDGEILFGEVAERRRFTDPERIVWEFKRRMGDPTPILLAGSPFAAHTLMALQLRAVVKTVAEREGGLPQGLVLTCPANWGDYKRELLDQAIAQAHVGEVEVVTEPEAAAVHYATTTRVAPGETVAVYDLGGGTFDAAVLRNAGDHFELLGEPKGIEQLGGVYFDEAVFHHVTTYIAEAYAALERDDEAAIAAVARLRRDCVEAKEALSWDTDATILVALPNLRTEVRLTRAEFETMIRPALAESVEAMRRALESAGVTPPDLKAVLLVGGSSRIPLVSQLLSEELRRPTAIDVHPKHAVALGAALLAEADAGGIAASTPAPAPPLVVERGPTGGQTEREKDEEPTGAETGGPEPPPGAGGPIDSDGGPAGLERFRVPALVGLAVIGVALAGFLGFRAFSGGDDDEPAEETGGTVSTTEAPDPDGGVVVDPGGEPIEVAPGEPLTPDTIAYTSQQGAFWNVWLIQQDGSNNRPLTREQGVKAQLPAISPDRTRVAYTVDNNGTFELWLTDSEGDAKHLISEELAADARATWSPDGNRLAFISDRDGSEELYVIDLRTSELRQRTDSPERVGNPDWSPDGETIAVWQILGGNQDIYLIPVEGGEPQRLTTDAADDAAPAWHPFGNKLAFASRRSGEWNVFVMNPDGSGQEQLTSDDVESRDPAWSPDGGYIAFGSKRARPDRDDQSELFHMLSDGSGVTRLTNHDGFDAHPSWGDAGSLDTNGGQESFQRSGYGRSRPAASLSNQKD